MFKSPKSIQCYTFAVVSALQDNERRLTGRHETSSIHAFSWGVADR